MANKSEAPFNGKVAIRCKSINSDSKQILKSVTVSANTQSNELQLVIDYPMGDDVLLWNEFRPSLYRLTAEPAGTQNILN